MASYRINEKTGAVSVYWRELDGAQKTLTLGKVGEVKQETVDKYIKSVDDRLAREREERRLGKTKDVPRVSVEDYWKLYLENTQVRGRTLDGYRIHWEHFLRVTKLKYVNDLTLRHVDAFKAARSKEAAPATVNNGLRALGSVFWYAYRYDWLTGTNVFYSTKTPRLKEEARLIPFLTKEEAALVLETAHRHSRDAYVAYLLGIYAGMRRGEIGAARYEWFRFEDDTIDIKGYPGFRTKTGDERRLPMHPHIKSMLQAEGRRFGQVFSQAVSKVAENAEDERRGVRHRHRYVYDFSRTFETVAVAAGWKKEPEVKQPGMTLEEYVQRRKCQNMPKFDCTLDIHTLRRTFITRCISEKFEPVTVMRWVGHSDAKTLFKYLGIFGGEGDLSVLTATNVDLARVSPAPSKARESLVAPNVRSFKLPSG